MIWRNIFANLKNKTNSILYFDIDEDWEIICVSFFKEYQMRLKKTPDEDMDWDEFLSYLYGLLSIEGCLFGRIVNIRSTSSDDYSKLSTEEKKIWLEWRQRHPECVTHVKKMTLKDLYGEE